MLEEQLELVLNLFIKVLSKFLPNLEVKELSLSECHKSDSRRIVFLNKAAPVTEVGHIAIHGEYFSRRMNMKVRGAEEGQYNNMFTMSGHINVTSLLAILL